MEAQLDVAPPALAAAYEDPPSHSGSSVLQRLSILEFSQSCSSLSLLQYKNSFKVAIIVGGWVDLSNISSSSTTCSKSRNICTVAGAG